MTDDTEILLALTNFPKIQKRMAYCGDPNDPCLSPDSNPNLPDRVLKTVDPDGKKTFQRMRRYIAVAIGLVEPGDTIHVVRTRCESSCCIRRAHLYISTRAEVATNTYGYGSGRCVAGHDMTAPGVMRVRASGRRECVLCQKERRDLDLRVRQIMGA